MEENNSSNNTSTFPSLGGGFGEALNFGEASKVKHYGYSTANDYSYLQLRDNAKSNRRKMTKAEWLLWQELKADKLGIHFRRQHIIGNYIVDFVCLKDNVVIEVDGDYHGDAAQVDADAYRDWYLRNRGFKVLHFTNNQVENDLEGVMSNIIKNLL